MSIDRQSVSDLESSTMRKRRFRRVSDMFKPRQALMRRERKGEKKFRLRNTIGNGKRKNERRKGGKNRVEKRSALNDRLFVSSLASSTRRQRKRSSRSCRPRECLSLLVSIEKSRKINFDVIRFFNFRKRPKFFLIFRRDDL